MNNSRITRRDISPIRRPPLLFQYINSRDIGKISFINPMEGQPLCHANTTNILNRYYFPFIDKSCHTQSQYHSNRLRYLITFYFGDKHSDEGHVCFPPILSFQFPHNLKKIIDIFLSPAIRTCLFTLKKFVGTEEGRIVSLFLIRNFIFQMSC